MNRAFEALCGVRQEELRGCEASGQMAWLFDGDDEVFALGSRIDYEATYWHAALGQSRIGCLLFESSRDALMTLAPPSWMFTDANQASLQLFGASSVAEFTALWPWEVSPLLQPDGQPSAGKAGEMISMAMRKGSHFLNGSTRGWMAAMQKR